MCIRDRHENGLKTFLKLIISICLIIDLLGFDSSGLFFLFHVDGGLMVASNASAPYGGGPGMGGSPAGPEKWPFFGPPRNPRHETLQGVGRAAGKIYFSGGPPG